MDTFVSVTAYGAAAPDAVALVVDELSRLEKLFNRYDLESDISRINAAAGNAPVKVSEDTLTIILESLRYSELTRGAFDITIGPLVDAWGFGDDDREVPDEQQIASARALVNYADVIVDSNEATVFLRREGMSLDLGGIAKGYAIDRAVEILNQSNVKSALINAGGDLYALGVKPDRSAWSVGVQDPRRASQMVAILPLSNSSVVTSGDYERFFIVESVRYHHILDPLTGWPARSGLWGVTIVAPSAVEADMLSTALFVLGAEHAEELLSQFDGSEALLIEEGGGIRLTPGLRGVARLLR